MTTQINGTTGVSQIQDGTVSAQAKLATAVVPLGVGQTWQDVTGSRVAGSTYTNSTGRPIFVLVSMSSGTAAQMISATVDGVVVGYQYAKDNGQAQSISLVVPSGSTYSATIGGTPTVTKWMELR